MVRNRADLSADLDIADEAAEAEPAIAWNARDYKPLPGVPDEMMDAAGDVRPVWKPFLNTLSGMTSDDLAERFARADRYLRDAGVFYRAYDGQDETRSWPFSHIPVIIDDKEWQSLAEGLRQRADLLEAMMADFYGENQLVSEGFVPPSLVAGNSEFLRPLVGVDPPGGHFLHFISFEIGRGPNGKWWVLADRAQAPSGAGFALENRVAAARSFSGIYSDMHVRRVASFFGAFRDALQSDLLGGDGRIGVLTPGPANETYYEHAYIARYLGISLLEGEDLVVVNDKLMVRTVAGPMPVSVLWRRLDASFTDPLELNQSSRLGTPGMVQAIRAGNLTMVNALGSGILETRALLAFLPSLSRRLLNEDLKIPSIATWWCGQEQERSHVADHLDRMVIGPAYSRMPFFDDAGQSFTGEKLRARRPGAVERWLKQYGSGLVGQEAVTLSTAPAFVDGRLKPHPFSLRVFAARTRDGWRIMPGGFARIGASDDVTAMAMQQGGRAADVWVVSDTPVARPTLLTQESRVPRHKPANLPSRAADNLFWLGRYIERAEGNLRILRAWHGRFAEVDDREQPLLAQVEAYLGKTGIDLDDGALPPSLLRDIDSAVFSAGNIRDRFSPDGWLALTDLSKSARRFVDVVQPGDDAAHAATVLLRKLAGFAGLVHENMYRSTGWRFLSIGRYLERGLHMTRLLGELSGEDAPDGAFDILLEIGDNVMTHRRHYNVNTDRLTITDLLALDPQNPRSVLFQLNAILAEVERLPDRNSHVQMSPLNRETMRLQAGLAVMTADTVSADDYARLVNDLEALSDCLAQNYL
ncbi:circularly permuted type 2 ATP-grasp protein [Martelella mediterranea]|uniref:Putative circularly permuted ATP-grasp superfamily protein n=1 Tax=Martelella mediterranea TaxID=293089 RepID=A0A4R3NPQ6_9HYPH|nr:circularly permuted type 2 ATP-grasp protein [Martelella mediterranea]TCT37856.1 putative circularly permuted ATP-grasp superfamily protein [Martelella mediterranea]